MNTSNLERGCGKQHTMGQKLQIKVLLEETAMTQRQLAETFNCSQSAIKNLAKKLKSDSPLMSRYRGRRRITTQREDRKIISTTLRLRRKPLSVIHDNILASGVQASKRTIKRRLKEKNSLGRRPAIKHKLTPAMIIKRMRWGKKYRHYESTLWSKIGKKPILVY